MRTLFTLFFGFLPSIIWLWYFLRKDVHPEPKKKLLLVFFFGMIIAFLAALLESLFSLPLKFFSKAIAVSFGAIIITPFIEEYLKFFVVKKTIILNPVFDEPMDLPIYMITVALGFAAVENIFLLIPFLFPFQIYKVVLLSYSRFISATFLHAISSGVLGVFLSYSFYNLKRQKTYFFLGLSLDIFLHSLYNFCIIEVRDFKGILILFLVSIIFLLFSFKKLRNMPSVCKIKL